MSVAKLFPYRYGNELRFRSMIGAESKVSTFKPIRVGTSMMLRGKGADGKVLYGYPYRDGTNLMARTLADVCAACPPPTMVTISHMPDCEIDFGDNGAPHIFTPTVFNGAWHLQHMDLWPLCDSFPVINHYYAVAWEHSIALNGGTQTITAMVIVNLSDLPDANGARPWGLWLVVRVAWEPPPSGGMPTCDYYTVARYRQVGTDICCVVTDESPHLARTYDPDASSWSYVDGACNLPPIPPATGVSACCDYIREAVPGSPNITVTANPCRYGIIADWGSDGAIGGMFSEHIEHCISQVHVSQTTGPYRLTCHEQSNPPRIYGERKFWADGQHIEWKAARIRVSIIKTSDTVYTVKVELIAYDETNNPTTFPIAENAMAAGAETCMITDCGNETWQIPFGIIRAGGDWDTAELDMSLSIRPATSSEQSICSICDNE